MIKLTATMRILHVITKLDTGGAEIMLLKLLSAGGRQNEAAVVSLGDQGTIGPRIAELGVPVSSLGLSGSALDPFRALSIRSITKRFRPDLIVGWMPHGNLMASMAAALGRRHPALLWNVRMSLYSLATEPLLTAAAIRLCRLLSRRPAAIVYNSLTGAKQHEALGYSASRRVIIPNGFDCQMFKPDPVARQSIRKEFGIPLDAILVGLMARYHPMKDHAGFFQAAGRVAVRYPNVYFVLAGKGVTREQPELAQRISAGQLDARVFLLGERFDMPQITASLDIACSASVWGEAFSNAIGEAMACAVPCVVTDIGDSRQIVAETGVCVPPRDPEAMAATLCCLIDAGPAHRKQLGTAARLRVEKEFSLETAVRRYQELYEKVQNQRRSSSSDDPLA